MEALRALIQQLLGIWKELGLNQKVTVVVSGVVMLIGLAVVVFYTSRAEYTLLYGGLDSSQAGKVTAALDEQSVPYRAGAGGNSIYVPREQVYKMRMQLAAQGIPKASGVGYEIFDKQTFGMSDFVQRANYRRAMQGELSRTISKMEGVESARVMIVEDENRLIVDPNKKPTASVFLNVTSPGIIDQRGVNSIRFLVANSVAGLKFNQVSVHDQSGILASNDDDGSLGQVSGNRLTMKQNVEQYLARKVQSMLEKVYGSGEVVVRVAANINHDSITSTDEVYDPQAKVERSITEKTENTANAAPTPGGTPGTVANTSVATNNAAPSITSNTLTNKQTVTEYAVSRSVTNVVKLAGAITRVAATVFINQNGTQQRTEQQLEVLKRAAQNALGAQFAGNTDTQTDITVIEQSFNNTRAAAMSEEMAKDKLWANIKDIVKMVLYVLLGAGALYAFWQLVKRSSEEVIPTGVPVGQLLAGPSMVAMPAAAGAPVAGVSAPMGAQAGAGAAPGPTKDTAAQLDTAAMNLDDIEEKLKDPSNLSVAQLQQLRQRREEEKERIRLLEEMKAEEAEEDIEVIEQEKQKLIMDFGLGKKQPERVNIEVLRDMIKENPDVMTAAARRWLSGEVGGDLGESENPEDSGEQTS
ncbi:MAG: flagellar basal-body MS-ring/collar protein FliF [Verrucomicrobiota bacterium]|nr:flagellar basal-body MS-ring/collar protein FliF [Verrucomicrobiota bacterium]